MSIIQKKVNGSEKRFMENFMLILMKGGLKR
jgi:hypothetical protein